MATAPPSTTKPVENATLSPATTGLRPYRMTIDVYERIVAAGVFGDNSRIFLWKGQLVEKGADMTKKPPHVFASGALGELLGDLVRGRGFFIQQEQPISLGDGSEPVPDLICVRGARRDYAARTPTVADCPLIVEIAAASLKDDQGEMLQGYADAGIPTYWIVNLPHRRIDVYTHPTGPSQAPPGYAQHQIFGPEAHVPVILDGHEFGQIAVRDVLP